MSQLKNIRTYNRGRKKCSECRFCAAKMDTQKLIDLSLEDNSLSYIKIISFLKLDIDLSENNKLPKAVCMECHKKCLECFNFFMTVRETQENLSVKYNNTDNTKSGTQDRWKGLENNVLLTNRQYNCNENRIPSFNNMDGKTEEIPLSLQCVPAGILSDHALESSVLLHSVLDVKDKEENSESKKMSNAFSNDISMNMDAIQNIDSEDIKPRIQNNVDSSEEINLQSNKRDCLLDLQISEIKSNHYNFRQKITQNCIDNAQSNDYEECEIKQEINDNNLDDSQSERKTQSKNTPQPSQEMNQYDTDLFINKDSKVKIEHFSEEINATPEQLSNIDYSTTANIDVINDLSVEMEVVSFIDQQETNSEIVIDKYSNILVCSGLNLFNNYERNDIPTDIVYPVEIIEPVKEEVKTEIQNSEDCYENYDTDTGIQLFEEDLSLTTNQNDTMYNDYRHNMPINTKQEPENSDGFSLVHERRISQVHIDTNNSFSDTLQNRSSDTNANLVQSKNKVEAKTVIKNNQNFMFFNNIDSNIRYSSGRTVKSDKSLIKHSDIELFNNFLKASRHANPINIAKSRKLLNVNNNKSCSQKVTQANHQNNVRLLNKSNTTVTDHGKTRNVGELVKGPEENNQTNVKLLNKYNPLVTHFGKILNADKEIMTDNDELHLTTSKNNTVNIKPWRFDHDDVSENDKTKTTILWKKKYVYNSTLKADVKNIIQENIEKFAIKEISRIDPEDEYLIEKSWETYPWCCGDCDAVFERVEDLRGHRQFVHKLCSGFLCWDCKDSFKLFGIFIEHVRVHRDYLRLFCEHCNQNFPNTTSYLNHATTHRTLNKCSHCGQLFPDETKLRDHRRLYKVKSKLQQDGNDQTVPAFTAVVLAKSDMTWKDYEWRCLYCLKVERDIQSLRAHTRDVHKKCFAVKCADCKRDPAQTLLAFARHVRLHRPYLRHLCYHCDRRFPNFADLTSHVDQHCWRDHLCPRCGESFEDENLLRQHLKQFPTKPKRARDKINLLCHFCGQQWISTKKFRVHVQRHALYSTMGAWHNWDKPFICDYCEMRFKTKNDIRYHILKQHNNHDVLGKNDTYVCVYCGKIYKSRRGLTEHMVKHIDNEKKEICKICDKRFLLRSALKAHAKTHVTDKPYTCDHCGKGFKTKNHIRNHIISHMDVKPHVCLDCGKRFKLKCNLTVHVRIHTDARPYQCEKCGKKFRDCPSCNKHMRNAHGITFFRTKITERGRVEIDRRSGETKSLAIDDDAKEWLRKITANQRKK